MNISDFGTPDRSFDRRPALRGHQADGSSVQNHSVGSHYPFVVGARETRDGLNWFVLWPNGREDFCGDAESAVYVAERLAIARRAALTPSERRTPWN